MGYISELRKIEGVGHRTLLMPCACLIIGDGKGNILLQRRVDDGTWGYHGGSMEIDESVEEALNREVREELNIVPEEVALLGIYSGREYHHVYPNGDEVSPVDIVHFCHKYRGEIKLQEDEVSEVGWFNKGNLPNLVTGHRRAIHDYLARFE